MLERRILLNQKFPLFDQETTKETDWLGQEAKINKITLGIEDNKRPLLELLSVSHLNWNPLDDAAYDWENVFTTPWKKDLAYSVTEADLKLLDRVEKLSQLPDSFRNRYFHQTDDNRPEGHEALLKIVTPNPRQLTAFNSELLSNLKLQIFLESDKVEIEEREFEASIDLRKLFMTPNLFLDFYPTRFGPLASVDCPEFEDLCRILRPGIHLRTPFDLLTLNTIQGRFILN